MGSNCKSSSSNNNDNSSSRCRHRSLWLVAKKSQCQESWQHCLRRSSRSSNRCRNCNSSNSLQPCWSSSKWSNNSNISSYCGSSRCKHMRHGNKTEGSKKERSHHLQIHLALTSKLHCVSSFYKANAK